MKNIFSLFLITLLCMSLSASTNFANDMSDPLPKGLTNAERELIQNDINNFYRSIEGPTRSLQIRKPEGIFWTPAEYDKAEGVCFSWSGYSSLLTQLIKEVAVDMKAFIGVSSYSQSSCEKTLKNAGVNMENIVFVPTRLDSVWMRDFGPWFIYTEDGDREVIDTKYNRPRPNDDKFPTTIADTINVPSHQCSLITPGGNMIFDGHGVYICTDVVFDPAEGGDPNLSVERYEQYMREYFGAKKVIIIQDMQRDGTGHVDMFCKLLDDRNLIVGEYASPSDGAGDNYNILNRNAARLANETNGKGEKFIVHRIPMPAYNYGTSYTHTNSLIANKHVLVPIYGRGTDAAALAVYRSILPDHKVTGFDCNSIIGANGAIHCITKLVMADPMEIKHTEIFNARSDSNINVNAIVESTRDVNTVRVYYSNSAEGPFAEMIMNRTRDNEYNAEIPASRENIYYYIHAESDTMYETYPEDAPVQKTLMITIN